MKPENIKIISSKIDRETKEGKIVIEVEEVPQSVNLLAKFFLKERSESDPDSGKLDEMDDYFMEVYQKNTGNSFSFARLKAIEAVLIKYGYQLPKEIPDEVVYRTVKASERKPIHLAHWNTDDGKDWSFPVIVDGEYGIGKFYDQRLVDEETPIYCIVVGAKDYYEDEFYKIEWLEPIQLKDLLEK